MQQTILESQERQTRDYESLIKNTVEARRCLKSPKYFLTKYAYILDRNTGQKVKWQPWSYLLDLLDIFETSLDIILVKARQLGWSWLVSGYSDHKVLFLPAARCLELSQGEDPYAWELLAKSRFIIQNLPPFLKLKEKHPDNRSRLDFVDNDSYIQVLASTEGAGRGFDATLAVRDESAKHPYGRENYRSISPAIDSGQAQMIDLSTIDKFDIENHFTERVNRALRGATRKDLPSGLCVYTGGESGAVLAFGGWKLRPTRQEGLTLEEWFETKIKAKYTPVEIEQEYPETLDEALSAPKESCRFDVDAITELKQYCDSPSKIERNGLVKIYKEPIGGRKYVFAIDASEGDYDPSLGQIIDARNLVKVAEFYGKIPLDEQAVIVYDLYERYGEPYTAVERNASGLALIRTLKDLGVTNWHYYDKKKEKEGWWTSGVSRPLMITDLAEAIRLREITEPNEQGLNEFLSFIRTDKKPEGEARRGTHDEYVMAWAIALQIRKYTPMGEMKITSFKYQD